MRIGILGQHYDAEADAVARALKERDVDTVYADLSKFPVEGTVSLRLDGRAPRVVIEGDDVTDIGAWYVRRFGYVSPLIKTEPPREVWDDLYGQMREWSHAENQKAMTIASMMTFLADARPMVNPPEAFWGHVRKPHQVHLLRAAGLPVPDFLVSNDADEVRRFLDKHDRVVYKPVAGGRLTREIDRDHFDRRAHTLKTEPILVQKLAEGRHVRAYVVDGEMIGAGEILFDRDERMDYRASSHGAEPTRLPASIAEEAVRAAAACGMPFTGLDVIIDDDAGTHAFLECNPSPMFVNFSRMTDIPVVERLADLLVDRARAG